MTRNEYYNTQANALLLQTKQNKKNAQKKATEKFSLFLYPSLVCLFLLKAAVHNDEVE